MSEEQKHEEAPMQEASAEQPASSKEEPQQAEAEAQAEEHYLSEELRAQSSIQKFKSADELAKGYIELEKRLGAQPPGVPEKYELGLDEKESEYLQQSGRDFEAFKQTAKELGLSNKQVSKLAKWHLAQNMSEQEAQIKNIQEAAAAEQEKLKALLGDKYEAKLKQAEQVADLYSKKFNSEDIKRQVGVNAALTAMLADLGDNMSSHEKVEHAEGQPGMSQEEAKQKIRDFWSNLNANSAYTNLANREAREAAIKEHEELYAQAYKKNGA